MPRRPLIAANWKMFKTIKDMEFYVARFLDLVSDVTDRDLMIAPSFVCLPRMAELLSGTNVEPAAQNMFYEDEGAFTGEISPQMLLDIGVRKVILGHSERRHIFGEGDDLINRKVVSALNHGMTPILCIGETLEEREADQTGRVIKDQLSAGLDGVSREDVSRLVVAYEPVWAIGTGKTASLDQISHAHGIVREEIARVAGEDIAKDVRILYGGSVKPENVKDIMAIEDVDGALVGGASLEPESFSRIVRYE